MHLDGVLTVWNRTEAKAEHLRAAGALVAPSLRFLCEQCDTVCLMLTGDESTKVAVAEALGCMTPPTLLVNFATVSPGCARECAERCAARRCAYVSCPVTGRPDRAAAGTLACWVSANEAGAARTVAEELCPGLADHVAVLSETDASTAPCFKLVTNFLIYGGAAAGWQASAAPCWLAALEPWASQPRSRQAPGRARVPAAAGRQAFWWWWPWEPAASAWSAARRRAAGRGHRAGGGGRPAARRGRAVPRRRGPVELPAAVRREDRKEGVRPRQRGHGRAPPPSAVPTHRACAPLRRRLGSLARCGVPARHPQVALKDLRLLRELSQGAVLPTLEAAYEHCCAAAAAAASPSDDWCGFAAEVERRAQASRR